MFLTFVALCTVYPEHDWKQPKNAPSGHWKEISNQKLFFDQLAPTLNIQSLEDWQSVNVKTVIEKGGWFITNYYNGSLIQGTISRHYVLHNSFTCCIS
jgi:hypothetical protein